MMIIIFPTSALAVDFSIKKSTIDAYLETDGTVKVEEQHTYKFDGEFGGITRELIPKFGASILTVEAFENGKALKVEEDDGLYRAHRKGEDETITVELKYTIENAMEKYADGAQFYWPFFDTRNESDYGDMTINIHPPALANDVQFLGYDNGYEKGSVDASGVVSFAMGYVYSGENGDVRVIYESDLFPDLVVLDGTIRDQLAADEKRLADEIESFALGQEKTKKNGSILLTIIVLLLSGLFGVMFKRGKDGRNEALYQLKDTKTLVPVATMSMPAIIHYTTEKPISPEMMAAGLLDLVRTGNVKQHSDDAFEIVNRKVAFPHELELIRLLFDKVGDKVHFKLGDLEAYTLKKENHGKYNDAVLKWREGIEEELTAAELVGKRKGIRSALAVISIGLGIAALVFLMYSLFLFMIFSALLSLTVMAFAFFYKPRNEKGHLLYAQWQQFQKAFGELDIDEWSKLSSDDKFRAFTYSVGSGDKAFSKHFNQFVDVEKRSSPVDSRKVTYADSGYDYMYYSPVMMSSSFTTASTNTAPVPSEDSSSSSSSGGGTGGGGGGSGAF